MPVKTDDYRQTILVLLLLVGYVAVIAVAADVVVNNNLVYSGCWLLLLVG